MITKAEYLENNASIAARDDFAAIDTFLQEYIYRQNTYSTYNSELKKFKCYLQLERKKLKDLKKDDFHHYIGWLQNPPENLINPKSGLFKKPCSPTAITHNIRIVNNLMNYLIEADYLLKNPLRLIKQYQNNPAIEGNKFQVLSRILDDYEVSLVMEAVNNLPEYTPRELEDKMRTELIISMLYYLGLRVSELSASIWSNFKMVQGKCWYFLIGKGGVPGKIPVNDHLLKIIRNYRSYYGKSSDLDDFEDQPILKSVLGGSLTARRIRGIVKEQFLAAARLTDSKQSKQKLQNASPHDFRHLLASNLDRLGASLLDTKEILRHSSEKTTQIYRHSQDEYKHMTSQKVSLDIGAAISAAKTCSSLKITVKCRADAEFGFRYFLNTLANNYLRKYRLKAAIDIEKMIDGFNAKAKTLQELTVKIDIVDLLKREDKHLLEKLTTQAAAARGLDLLKVELL